MTSEDIEGRLRRRMQQAVESLPGPDRGRLARIEQGALERGGCRMCTRLRHALWAALLGATVAAAGGVAYWSHATRSTTESTEETESETLPSGTRNSSDAFEETEQPMQESGDSRKRDRIIYQR